MLVLCLKFEDQPEALFEGVLRKMTCNLNLRFQQDTGLA
jgi:hypothetical protein